MKDLNLERRKREKMLAVVAGGESQVMRARWGLSAPSRGQGCQGNYFQLAKKNEV